MTGEEEPLVKLLREKLGDDSPWSRLTKKARRQYREAAEALAEAGALRADKKAGGLRRVAYACLISPTGEDYERNYSFLYGALRRGLEGYPVAICTACGLQDGVPAQCQMCGGPTEIVEADVPLGNEREALLLAERKELCKLLGHDEYATTRELCAWLRELVESLDLLRVQAEERATPPPLAGWEPQQHGEWGDWALPDKPGPHRPPRPYVTRLPDGSLSLTLDVARSVGIVSYQFSLEETRALVAIIEGRIKGRWER